MREDGGNLGFFLATVKGVGLHDVGGVAVFREEEVALLRNRGNTYDATASEGRRPSPRSPGQQTAKGNAVVPALPAFQTQSPNRMHECKGQHDVSRFP